MEKDMSLHEAHMQIEYLEKMLAHAVKAIPHKCFTCRNGYHSDNGFDCDQTHYKSGNPDCLSWDWAGIATAEETAADLNGLNVCNIWKVVASFRRGCIEPLPCKVGDTVYELRGDTEEDIVEAVIKRIECDKYGWKIWVTPADYNQTHQVRVRLQDYDKRFFSFREDAVDEIYWKKETKSMKNPNIEFCKKGISVVTENANGEAYTIIARHISDVVRDWNGPCNFVPANDARVYFVVMGGIIKAIPENYTFEVLVKELMEKLGK